MGKYFDRFPRIYYSVANNYANPIAVTDVTFPIRILEPFASDTRYFYTQVIKDGLKPEDVAYLVYGDVQLHWVVLQFNKIVNPRFEWPMSSVNLEAHIVAKYGSIANAHSTIVTYYKVIKRVSDSTDIDNSITHTQKIEIGAAEYANVTLDLAGTDYLLEDGTTTKVIVDRETLSAYDWELQENEKRREIRLIQKPYMEQIKKSFSNILNNGTK
jgi:hypothetical protein